MPVDTWKKKEDRNKLLESSDQTAETLRKWLGMSQTEFAEMLGVSRRTVARWEAEPPNAAALRMSSRKALEDAFRLEFLLDSLLGRDEAVSWLRKPNRGFKGATPLALLTDGSIQEVVLALDMVASGGEF